METKSGDLSTDKCSLEVERSRLERECDVHPEKLNELIREFSLVKEKGPRAYKRYGDLLNAIMKMEETGENKRH